MGALGLNFRTEQRESDKPVNEVVDQSPAPGEVSPVQQIVIWVSSGIPQIEIPNVVGLDSTAAISQLAALGLSPKAVPQPSDRVEAGKPLEHAGKDDLGERPRRRYDARGEAAVIAIPEHDRQRDEAHRHH